MQLLNRSNVKAGLDIGYPVSTILSCWLDFFYRDAGLKVDSHIELKSIPTRSIDKQVFFPAKKGLQLG
jgi:hypothetical protein